MFPHTLSTLIVESFRTYIFEHYGNYEMFSKKLVYNINDHLKYINVKDGFTEYEQLTI